MREQLSLAGWLPTHRTPERYQVDGGNHKSRLAREVEIERLGELCTGGQVHESIRLVDGGASEGVRVECGPLIGGEYLVSDPVLHAYVPMEIDDRFGAS
jgi:hypothetical protein